MPSRSLTSPAPLRDLRALLESVVKEINDAVPTDRELRRRWQERETKAAKALVKNIKARATAGQASVDDLITADSHDRELDKDWRDYHAGERAYYAQLFRDLATDGRLSRGDLQTLAYMVDQSALHFRTRVVGRHDDARVVMQPEFEVPHLRWAYAVLKLVEAGQAKFRVVVCKKPECGRLVLVDLGVKGRPREFCSDAHSNAYAQAAWQRRKALAAAKHK